MTHDTTDTEAQTPMEIGQENARRFLSGAIEHDAENPTQAAAERAIENYQRARDQQRRAEKLADAAAHTMSILRTVHTMDDDGIIEAIATDVDDTETEGVRAPADPDPDPDAHTVDGEPVRGIGDGEMRVGADE